MHIAFIDIVPFDYNHNFIKNICLGGTQALTAQLCKNLAKNKIKITHYGVREKEYILDNVNYRKIDNILSIEEDYEFIIFTSLANDLSYKMKEKFKKTKFILWTHGNRLNSNEINNIDHLFNNIIFVSDYARKKNIDLFDNENKLITIKNFLVFDDDMINKYYDLDLFNLKDNNIISYIGNVSKGLYNLNYIIPNLRKHIKKFKVQIFSEPHFYLPTKSNTVSEDKILQNISNFDEVIFFKKTGKEEMCNLLEKSNIFISPNTFNESFCLSLIEAMFMELKCVTTNRSAIPETANKYAVYTPTLNPTDDNKQTEINLDQFIENIYIANENYFKHEKEIKEQKQYVFNKYHPKKILKKWLDFFTNY